MTATRIPDALTTLDELGLLSALAEGYRQTMGGLPSAPCLSVVGAQVFLETGRGQKMHCWNPGNRKLPADWDGLYTSYRCDEIFDAQTAARAQKIGTCWASPWRGGPLVRVVLDADHPWARFCAFPTADAGMADYVALLACSDRYRGAWTLAVRGDADGFARALGHEGYYTAPVDSYAHGVVSIATSLRAAASAVVGGADHILTDDDRDRIAAAVSATVADATIWSPDRHDETPNGEEYPLQDAPNPPGAA